MYIFLESLNQQKDLVARYSRNTRSMLIPGSGSGVAFCWKTGRSILWVMCNSGIPPVDHQLPVSPKKTAWDRLNLTWERLGFRQRTPSHGAGVGSKGLKPSWCGAGWSGWSAAGIFCVDGQADFAIRFACGRYDVPTLDPDQIARSSLMKVGGQVAS